MRTTPPPAMLVLGQSWSVEVVESLVPDDAGLDKAILGHCDPDAQRIQAATMRGGEPIGTDAFTDTILHESLHAMLAMTDLTSQFRGRDDEPFVRRLTPVLLDWMRSNKTLVEWLITRDA